MRKQLVEQIERVVEAEVPRVGAAGYDTLQFRAPAVCVAHEARHSRRGARTECQGRPYVGLRVCEAEQHVWTGRGRNACRAVECARVGTGMVGPAGLAVETAAAACARGLV